MTPTDKRRVTVLAAGFACLLAILLGSRVARADDIPTPLCKTGEDVLAAFWPIPLVNVIGKTDQAKAVADAFADRFNKPHVSIRSIFVFAGSKGVAVFGFDDGGCLAVVGTMQIATFNGVVAPLGVAGVPLPPDPNAI